MLAEGSSISLPCNTFPEGIVYDSPNVGHLWMDPATVVPSFWDYIKEWGSEWMWEMIYLDIDHSFDVTWMIEVLRAGNLVGASDGSYDRSRNAFVCGAGWILMDKTTGERLAGLFLYLSLSEG